MRTFFRHWHVMKACTSPYAVSSNSIINVFAFINWIIFKLCFNQFACLNQYTTAFI